MEIINLTKRGHTFQNVTVVWQYVTVIEDDGVKGCTIHTLDGKSIKVNQSIDYILAHLPVQQ